MSDAQLHTKPPRSPWPRRGWYLARNTAIGFAVGVVLWVVALLSAAAISLAFITAHAAAGAWQAAWTPSGFLYVGALMAGFAALFTIGIWAVIDRKGAAS